MTADQEDTMTALPTREEIAGVLRHAYEVAPCAGPCAGNESDLRAADAVLAKLLATMATEWGVALMADDPDRVEMKEFLVPHTEESARVKAARQHPAYEAAAVFRHTSPWRPAPAEEEGLSA